MRTSVAVFLFNSSIAAVLSVAPASAETVGRAVKGTVTDPAGAVVSGAEVSVACGVVSRTTTTGADGTFGFANLPPIRCAVRIEDKIFASRRIPVDLSRDNADVAVRLNLRGLSEYVAVTASRGVEESVSRIPAKTTVVETKDIRTRMSQHLPQALAEEPGVVVQQTTAAAGAPIIRGLIGYQNVFMIDGVRLNTSAWRSGPVQYASWYAASIVDTMEVVRGPGSVLYGSDAMGGTVQVRSVRPSFSDDGLRVGGVADFGASSADAGRGVKARLDIRGRRASLIAGGGYDRFDDIHAGQGIDSHAAVTRFLGLPSSAQQTDVLPRTGYDQRFSHLAGAIALGRSSRLDASYHYDEQTGASRYDRIDGGDGLFRSEFSPQRLDITQVRFERGRTAFFDGIAASFSVNRQADGRLEQSRPTANVDAQQNITTSVGYQVTGVRSFGRHGLTLGTEVYDDHIGGSRAVTTPAGVVTSARPDIPDGTRYTSVGLFAQDIVQLVPNRLSVRGGLRYGRFGFSTTAAPSLGVVDESVTSDAVTFQAGAVVSPMSHLTLSVSGGRGFRAANASDLGVIGVTSVFEVAPSRAAFLGGLMGSTEGATAVSTGRPIEPLRPEELYSFEAGVRYEREPVAASLTWYTTELRDAIQRRTIIFPVNITGTSIGGYDVVRVDAAGRAFIAANSAPMVTRVNVAKAQIRGVEGDVRVKIARDWLASTFFSYSQGTDLDANVPLRRVPPGVGGVRLRWQPRRGQLWVEGLGAFMTRYTRMAPGDLTDARMGGMRTTASIASYFNGTATDLGLVRNGVLVATGETLAQVQQRVLGGSAQSALFSEIPGRFVTTIRGGITLRRNVDLIVVGENLSDVNYRHLGSGVDAPARHVRISTRVTF